MLASKLQLGSATLKALAFNRLYGKLELTRSGSKAGAWEPAEQRETSKMMLRLMAFRANEFTTCSYGSPLHHSIGALVIGGRAHDLQPVY